jgi:hypothetical protein
MKKITRFVPVALLFLTACLPQSGNGLADAAPIPSQTPQPQVPTDVPASPEAFAEPALDADDTPPRGAEREFSTDFSVHSVPYSEILSGGPPKDGIPALDEPGFVSVREADAWLEANEPVVLVQVGDEAKAYPIQVLMWHEIANDTVGDEPLAVTFCPLCNTAIVFRRTVVGQVLDFGTTGRLRYSNLIMYDRQTETWWQQATGEAIAGELTGMQLEFYPAAIVSWQDFKASHPDGVVLSRETGFSRDYGRNPYIGYDDVNSSPFLYRGPETPGQLPAVARVLTIDLNGEAVAYPYATLEEIGVANDTVGGDAVAVFWQPGTVSPLDSSTTASGRDIGAAASFSRRVDEQILTFVFDNGAIKDQETGSVWNLLGTAESGSLAGTQLAPVVSINHFWFSWAAFRPETRIFEP